jgi:hypothetical protein
MAGALQMPDQEALADAGLDETGFRIQVRQQGLNPSQRRRVRILGHAREGAIGALAHYLEGVLSTSLQDRLDDVLGQEAHDRDRQAVAYEVIGFAVIARQLVIVTEAHQPGGLARR